MIGTLSLDEDLETFSSSFEDLDLSFDLVHSWDSASVSAMSGEKKQLIRARHSATNDADMTKTGTLSIILARQQHEKLASGECSHITK